MEKQPRLGRIPQPDARDVAYPVRSLLAPTSRRYRYWYDGGAWLDQGQTGTCVGHGWAHFIEDSPVTHPDEAIDAFDWYRAATLLDPWPDNDGDLQAGTSVRAGAQVGVARGYFAEYRWASDIDDLANTVLTLGPAVIGIDWYDAMFDPQWLPDATGDGRWMVVPEGGIAGGHCLLVNGVSLDRRTFRLKNSWGRGWGVDGRASIRFDDLAMLLDTGGEACIAFERKALP